MFDRCLTVRFTQVNSVRRPALLSHIYRHGALPIDGVQMRVHQRMMNELQLRIFRLPHGAGIDVPSYETAGAAGMDIRAAVSEPVLLAPGMRALVQTGFVMAVDDGFEIQVRPRSGLAFKHGVTCLNTPGTIDSDYRGEVKVLLINHGDAPFEITRGMRIAQLVVAPVIKARVKEMNAMPDSTGRGAGGFGSTGTS